MLLIGDKYKLEADSLNIILFEKRTLEQDQVEAILTLAEGQELDESPDKNQVEVETGIRWKLLGYFNTITGALRYMVDHKLNQLIDTGDIEKIVIGQQSLYMLINSLDLSTVPTIPTKQNKKVSEPCDKPDNQITQEESPLQPTPAVVSTEPEESIAEQPHNQIEPDSPVL
jgi:hypothetical protein